MNNLYDVTTLPQDFVEIITNFLTKLNQTGAVFFYPDEQKLMLGEAYGDKHMYNLADFFSELLDLNDLVYLIRVAICQQHFTVYTVAAEANIERHENYRTIFIRAY